MYELKPYDADDDQSKRGKSAHMARVSEEDDAGNDCSRGSNPSPNSISGANGDRFHRLGHGKKAHENEDYCDNTRDEFGKPLAKLQSHRETDLEKTSQ